MSENMRYQTIELDCPPGDPRPKDLIRGVIEGLDIEPMSWDVKPIFGHAEYAFDIPWSEWESRVQPVIIPRIKALYNAGVIRYGSW